MLKKIAKNNKIFQSANYLKDASKFYVIKKNFSSADLVIYSDEETYLLCRGKENLPTWIWTIDNFPKEKLPELEAAIALFLTDNEKDKFTCKQELYFQLIRYNYTKINREDYFEMGTLCCYKPKKPRACAGYMSKPTLDEEELLSEYWYLASIETEGIDAVTKDQARKDIKAMLDAGNLYIWRDNDNKIVSMANYKIILPEAEINHVYTPKEERNKGYAANLIYNLTKELLNKDLKPLLYTDYNYLASNKAYINAGYEPTGILINFSCSKNK